MSNSRSVNNHLPEIKLEGSNYRQWQEEILIALMGINARRIVMKEELAPANNATQLRESYLSRCDQAANLLHRSCGIAAVALIKNIYDPIRIWEILDAAYGTGRSYDTLIPVISRFNSL